MNAGDPIVTIGRTDTVTIEFSVDQHDLEVLKTGQPVRLRVDGLPGRTFEGTLVFLGELPSDSAGQVRFPARAAVPNPGGLLRTGVEDNLARADSKGSKASRHRRDQRLQCRLVDDP